MFSVTFCEPSLGASPLELSFADASFQDLCSRRDALARAYGTALTKTICCRFAVLTGAPTLEQVPMGLPIGLTRLDQEGTYTVAVGATHRLIFKALPKETAAMNDLSQITKLLVIGLEPNPSAKAGQ